MNRCTHKNMRQQTLNQVIFGGKRHPLDATWIMRKNWKLNKNGPGMNLKLGTSVPCQVWSALNLYQLVPHASRCVACALLISLLGNIQKLKSTFLQDFVFLIAVKKKNRSLLFRSWQEHSGQQLTGLLNTNLQINNLCVCMTSVICADRSFIICFYSIGLGFFLNNNQPWFGQKTDSTIFSSCMSSFCPV